MGGWWTVELVGAFCFGLVVGWVTYRSLRRNGGSGLSDIATVIGAVGGGAVTALFKSPQMFGAYSIGLASGFFLFLMTFLLLYGKGDRGVQEGSLMGKS